MNAERAIGGIVVRPATAADAANVDAFVRAMSGATPFHLPRWTDAVARGCGQEAHYLVAESFYSADFSPSFRRKPESTDTSGFEFGRAASVDPGFRRDDEKARSRQILGVLPLNLIHSPLFGRALVSSGFAVGGGILAVNEGTMHALAQAGWDLAERLSCASLELRGGCAPEGWQRREGEYAGFVRPLAADDEAELLAIPRKQRAEVRKALEQGFTITTGTSEADRAAHYSVYAESVRNLGTPVFPRSLFDAVLDAFGDEADILTVLHDGTPVASVLSLYFDGAVMPYWGGGTLAARRLRANEAMYFALMGHARARGCDRFDFGRSKLGTGAFAYKKNWGFVPAPLGYAVRTADGAAPREINPLSPKYRLQIELWRRLPLWVANRLGPPIARGLG